MHDYITELLPWAHGHQLKAFVDFVAAILVHQTANQAALAHSFGNPEAAVKRLSGLLHNRGLSPKDLAEAVWLQALSPLPSGGKLRLAIDWTIEGDPHLLVVSLVTGGRGAPIDWLPYSASVLKGRRRRYEMALIKVFQPPRQSRPLRVTADGGFADLEVAQWFEDLGVASIIRGKHSAKIFFCG